MKVPFLEFFSLRECPITLVDKRTSTLMRLINLGLILTNKLGITRIEDFLGSYTTTLRRSIYASPAWSRNTAPTPHVVHELTHVLQWSFLYALRYLSSAKWRLYYEASCIQTSMLCFPTLRTEQYCRERAEALVGYGVTKDGALAHLRTRLNQIRFDNNKIPSEVRAVHKVYVTWLCQ